MILEVSTAQDQNEIIRQTGYGQGFGLKTSAHLALKTKEGDRVTFSLDDQFGFSQSGQETQLAGGGKTFEFSLSARAAVDFSLSVEGDLNKEELAAIRALTQALVPITQSFYVEDDFDLERSQEVLSDKLGVIEEVEVNLQKTVQALASVKSYSQGPVEGLEKRDVALSDLPIEIRDLNGLVQSVVNSVFHPLEIEFPEDSLMQTFAEFKNFLTEQVVKLLSPEIIPKLEALPAGEPEDTSGQIEESTSISEIEEPVPQTENPPVTV